MDDSIVFITEHRSYHLECGYIFAICKDSYVILACGFDGESEFGRDSVNHVASWLDIYDVMTLRRHDYHIAVALGTSVKLPYVDLSKFWLWLWP